MLDRYRLIRLLVSLGEARKAVFDVVCKLGSNKYSFHVDRFNSITVTITNEETEAQVVSTYEFADNINIPEGKYKVLTITESIYTTSKRLYTQTIHYCIELVQIYLPVFRVLGEQVVFLLKHKDGIKKMYFINGRVFYTEVDDECITLHQTDLRKVFNDFPNSEIKYFEKLPDRYSYNLIIEECRQKSVKESKEWKFVKKGVVV